MSTPTTPLPLPTTDRARYPFLSVFLPTAPTLAAVLSLGAWLFRGGASDAPVTTAAVEQSPTVVSEVLTGRKRGGLAELQEDLGWQPPAPYFVYLVESAERQRAMTNRGLAEGESVLLAGTSEEQVAAHAHIALLEMNVSVAPDAREVRVIDLRTVRNSATVTAAPAPDQPHFTP